MTYPVDVPDAASEASSVERETRVPGPLNTHLTIGKEPPPSGALARAVPYLSVTALGLVLCLFIAVPVQAAPPAPENPLERWVDGTAMVRNLLASLAILVGGAWGWFRFFKGRTFAPQLESSVNGTHRTVDGNPYLRIEVGLKNSGTWKVDLAESTSLSVERAAALDFGFARREGQSALRSGWHRLATYRAFEQHERIEPNEVIKEVQLVALPKYNGEPIRVQLSVFTSGATATFATDVVMPSEGESLWNRLNSGTSAGEEGR